MNDKDKNKNKNKNKNNNCFKKNYYSTRLLRMRWVGG